LTKTNLQNSQELGKTVQLVG